MCMLVVLTSILFWLCSFVFWFYLFSFFFFNDTATTEIYTLSLHDALPIWALSPGRAAVGWRPDRRERRRARSEEHTSELQSLRHLVCRLLLEKKKKNKQDRRRHERQHAITGQSRRIAAVQAAPDCLA